jgi:hypothetical protein
MRFQFEEDTAQIYDTEKRKYLNRDDIVRGLTEFYTLKAKQEECGKTGHEDEYMGGMGFLAKADFCRKCGQDLRGST